MIITVVDGKLGRFADVFTVIVLMVLIIKILPALIRANITRKIDFWAMNIIWIGSTSKGRNTIKNRRF